MFLALIVAALIAVQSPAVQTRAGETVSRKLSENIDGDIRFEKIHFRPFTTLIIKNLVILDKHPSTPGSLLLDPIPGQPPVRDIDTLFRAEYVIAKFSLSSLLGREGLHLAEATVSNAGMNLVLEEDGVNLTRMFKLGGGPKKEPDDREIFYIRNVAVENMDFRMLNHRTGRQPSAGTYTESGVQQGIDWTDLEVKNIDIDAHGMRFKGGVMTGVVHRMSFRERSGFNCRHISGDVSVGNGRTNIVNLRIMDDYSDLSLPLYRMDYENAKAFGDFIDSVRLTGRISTSDLDFRTIAYFAPALTGNDLALTVSGGVEGCVSGLHFKDIDATMKSGGFRARINGSLSGIPDTERMFFDCTVSRAAVTSDGLDRFLRVWNRSGKEPGFHFADYAKGLEFAVNADVMGYLNDLQIVPHISSPAGHLNADFALRNVTSRDRQMEVDGLFHTRNLNLGLLSGLGFLGECTLDTGLNLSLPRGERQLNADIDSLFVGKLHLYGYDYSNLAAAGRLSPGGFDGKIVCSDPNLNFLFQGIFAPSKKTGNSVYKFYANLGYADLNALHLDKRGKSRIRLRTSADFNRTEGDDLLGHINIDDIRVENQDGVQDVGRINLNAIINDETSRIRLRSDFLSATYTGTGSILHFVNDLKDLVLAKEAPAMTGRDEEYVWSGKEYSLKLNCHDSRKILSYVMPGLYVADSTAFSLGISRQGELKTSLTSQRIAFNSNYLKGVSLNADNRDDNITGIMTCEEANISSISLENNKLRLFIDNNHLGLGYSFDNGGDNGNHGEMYALGDLSRSGSDSLRFDVHILPSALYFNSQEWKMLESRMDWTPGRLNVSSLSVTNGDQQISASGGISRAGRDTLSVVMERFDVSVINPLIGMPLDLRGAATGTAQLISPLDDKGLLFDVICDSTGIAGEAIGTLYAHTGWNRQFSRFDIDIRNSLDDVNTVTATARYTPSIRNLDAEVVFSDANVGYAKPFVSEIFDRMEGRLSGKLMLNGPVDFLEARSEGLRVDDAWVNVAYINVPYNVSGPFHLDSYGAHLDNIVLKDRFGEKGTLNGSLTYDHFHKLGLDMAIRVDRMEVMNTDEKQNPDFYGRLFATGNLSITGLMNDILMDIDAVTAKQGQIHIPIPNTTNAGTTNLLTFKEEDREIKIDPYEQILERFRRKQAAKGSNFEVKLRVGASPAVRAFIEIDKESGNVLSAVGEGIINIDAGTDRFDINGDYTISSGSYKFVALGIVSRDFGIKSGSTVRFNGDILDSDLNIDASYRTKASIATLLSDDDAVSNRRTVECGIAITDKLSNPRIGLSINIPDIDPAIRSKVENALSTEDKIQKQFLSLIISNNFLPDEQSGIFNNSSVLYSNVSEIMSNQLNTILEKLNIPVDLGLSYQPNTQGNDVFDVAISTKLFNNRVEVNGNIGNRQYSASGNSNVVGDLDIEIKLDKKGSVRLNLFSHSADQYTNYLDNSQRNGVGVVYQTEFNNMAQFFRNMIMSRQKRAAAREAEEKAMIDGGMNTISLGKERNADENAGRNGKGVKRKDD